LNLPRSTTFSKEENVFRIYALDYGFDLRKTRGLFNRITPEGVSSDLDHRIGSERSRFKRERMGAAHRPEKKAARWRAIAGGKKARRCE
jgi:hypothetical protein